MKKIIVTGPHGLIGGELCKRLKDDPSVDLTVITHSASIAGFRLVNIDFSTDWEAGQLPAENDVLIHLAQSEWFRDFPNSAMNVFYVNTLSTLKLLEYARRAGTSKFIFASSGGIYGSGEDEWKEDFPITMRSDLGFYLTTKLCSELIVQNYSRFFNIDILRFFFVYGKGQRESMLIPRLINQIKEGKAVEVNGEDGIRLNPIHVSDAVEAVLRCFHLTGYNKINVAGNQVYAIRQMCEIIADQLEKHLEVLAKPDKAENLIADITKMKRLLFTPKVTFEDGVRGLL